MLPAIYFDNQSSFETNKIRNVISQWLLPTKLESVNLPKAKPIPEQPFDVRRTASQLSSSQPSLIHSPILSFPRKGERNQQNPLR
jgi:hypothetical protein